LGASLAGVDVTVACPPGFEPDPTAVDAARSRGIEVLVTADIGEAVAGVDAVYTDTWISMGQEDDAAQRRSAFSGFTVDASVMALADPAAVFLHCLPAHRGDEVTGEVIDGPQSLVWLQAANRMHAFRGLLLWLFGSDL
jgi:ornithine carbamoyltransferase